MTSTVRHSGESRNPDIVGPVLFLASDKAGQITGQTLFVNGGDLMW
jgi:NAD(P)-dependent dehydrogenase (short-subunit alcohol dehydrogenase family)